MKNKLFLPLLLHYFLGAIQIIRDTRRGRCRVTLTNNTRGWRGLTKMSRDIFCLFSTIVSRFKLFFERKLQLCPLKTIKKLIFWKIKTVTLVQGMGPFKCHQVNLWWGSKIGQKVSHIIWMAPYVPCQ